MAAIELGHLNPLGKTVCDESPAGSLVWLICVTLLQGETKCEMF